MTRSITLWTLLVAVFWATSISLHVNARSQQVTATHGATMPITMGVRN